MGEQTTNHKEKRLCVGLLAHVDAGKPTLSGGLQDAAGARRRLGRVDNRDAFLDTHELERGRGITIFSKQAELTMRETRITLLDTPGHVDFSAEMERTLQVLDAAVLVISGADGVQGHTLTLWRLLARHGIPVFLFVNKMDQPGTDRQALLRELQETLDDGCLDFTEAGSEAFYETVSTCGDEALLDRYLEEGAIDRGEICQLIRERRVFPCYFGSALRMQGVEELLEGLDTYTETPVYPEIFGARVFKIARDDQGNRLTYLKVTGGTLAVRSVLTYTAEGETKEEKVSQIRRYSGARFEPLNEAEAGTVCAVLGLSATWPGQGLGAEMAAESPMLTPVLSYQIILPEGMEPGTMLPKLRQLEEEEPELHIVWDEALREIRVQIMGEVQLEILQSLIEERFGVEVTFGEGSIVYRETIADTVEGVGHFEPLRHYAEVHLLLTPGERGSGLVFDADCSEDVLSRNWQRLVLTHLAEKTHRGVLTGSPITDLRITLVSGRAHLKHTEGGDFRQATYRAVRQGLMQATSVLLEPWYKFRLEVPVSLVGRAMTDIENRHGVPEPPVTRGEMSLLAGIAPVATMRNYAKDVLAYTRGKGRLTLEFHGYLPCHNTEEAVAAFGYDPEADPENPTGSVFCAHGVGFTVAWDHVQEYMHLECRPELREGSIREDTEEVFSVGTEERWIGTDEIDAILARTFYANGKDRSLERKGIGRREFSRTAPAEPVRRTWKPKERKEEYLLVDGYNIIFAWPELSELAKTHVDAAREALLDILCNYQGLRRCQIIAVFDAYRVQGHCTEFLDYLNIHVVYTKEAETADQYIEKFTHENASRYQITVATSDGLEQIIIRGEGCRLLSAQDLREEIERASREMHEERAGASGDSRAFLLDSVSEEVAMQLKMIRDGREEGYGAEACALPPE
ncbi:MAG: TetM/TetW/TetO/TetS family tetracycline resistance ribosomal protection protein [Lachnospiraceae bacterium]|nr:TetM/TetW/TetO/TetS family tetracycline resistance ribosomal protection protein [Lachnospiraceae bacterium]